VLLKQQLALCTSTHTSEHTRRRMCMHAQAGVMRQPAQGSLPTQRHSKTAQHMPAAALNTPALATSVGAAATAPHQLVPV
jgi:hypothetical protein